MIYDAKNITASAAVASTAEACSKAKRSPQICGTTISGAMISVASGFAIARRLRPRRRISRKRITSWWKWSRSGLSAGLASRIRRHIASAVSAIGQKKINSMAKGLSPSTWFASVMPPQTRQCPMR